MFDFSKMKKFSFQDISDLETKTRGFLMDLDECEVETDENDEPVFRHVIVLLNDLVYGQREDRENPATYTEYESRRVFISVDEYHLMGQGALFVELQSHRDNPPGLNAMDESLGQLANDRALEEWA